MQGVSELTHCMIHAAWSPFKKQYDLLMRKKSQKAKSFRVKDAMFKEAIIPEIMNIAQFQAEKMINNEEFILFLVMQHEDFKFCSVGSANIKLHRKEMRKRKRI